MNRRQDFQDRMRSKALRERIEAEKPAKPTAPATREKLMEYVTEFREGFLEGRESTRCCFVICFPLEALLNFEMGIDCKMRQGSIDGLDHWWLECPDGTIIDPTADQFPNYWDESEDAGEAPPVFIGPKPAWYSHEVVSP